MASFYSVLSLFYVLLTVSNSLSAEDWEGGLWPLFGYYSTFVLSHRCG